MDELKIYQKWVDATKDAYNLLKKFPKEERFVLAAQIREKAMEIGGLILSINETWDVSAKQEMANKMDMAIKSLRALWRLALSFGYITEKNYLAICDKWIEIGKILGGWKKTFQPRR